jgi:hypothetical protein
MVVRRRTIAALAGLVLAVWTGGASAQETAIPPERVLYRDVAGTVVDAETGQPMPGVPVTLLYEVTVTDDAGAFRFEKVPLTHTAEVSLRIRSKEGLIIGCMTVDVPVRFYPIAASTDGKFDIAVIDPGEDRPVALRPKTLPPHEVTRYCGECHENNPCLETGSYQDVVRSGKDLRGIIVPEAEVRQFIDGLKQKGLREETYRKMRYQDTHPDEMNMGTLVLLALPQYKGQYAFPDSLRLLEERYVTCDTCHTRHVPTEQKHYVVESYEQDNQLCFNCHL